MSKKNYMFLLCAMMLTLVACGKENNTSDVENENQQITDEATEDVDEEQTQNKDSDVLLGVYDGATDYMELPMGTFYEGEQKEFCKVKLPLEYVASANYNDENGTSLVNESIYGIKVEDIDLSENNVANQGVIIGSSEGTELVFTVVPTSIVSLDDEKEYAGEYETINTTGYEAIYYVGEGMTVVYQLNDNILLHITYEGPMIDEIGVDQLAQNIYDLVEVIE